MSSENRFPQALYIKSDIQTLFETLSRSISNPETEALTFSIQGEDTLYLRFNQGKVRQAGTIPLLRVSLTLQLRASPTSPIQEATRTTELTGDLRTDQSHLKEIFLHLRREAEQTPENPYAAWPEGNAQSETTSFGSHLPLEHAAKELLTPAQGLDFTGIAASGTLLRVVATSTGIFHYFATSQSTVDYSVVSSRGKAVKGEWASRDWNAEAFAEKLNEAKKILPILEKTPRSLPRGEYRSYLNPAAVADLIAMFSWGTLSEASIQQGDSALLQVRQGKQPGFSPFFHLTEDFQDGSIPAFNERGELAPSSLPLIEAGQLKNTLVNTRSAREYQVISNGANSTESLRSPRVAAGTLASQQALSTLGTGLWLSNLHYLNWSDQAQGRMTGMTRHACLWVENGEPVAPIESLRFDDTLFRLLGSELEALTLDREALPDTDTYQTRKPGMTVVPGALVRSMRFTL